MVDLSTPHGRGGHSLVAASPDTLLSFGGYSCRGEAGGARRPFHDFATALVDDPKVSGAAFRLHCDFLLVLCIETHASCVCVCVLATLSLWRRVRIHS